MLKLALLSLATGLLLGGCAAPPARPHPWFAISNADHLPMQGLPAVPRVIAEERPLILANLDNEAQRDARRRSDVATGTAAGAVHGGLLAWGAFWPLCPVLPSVCVGVTAAAGAAGGALAHVAAVSAEEASRLAAVFRAQATSAALQQGTSKGISSQDEQAGELRLQVLGAVMVPARSGVTFRLVAQAQAFPPGSPEWKPTLHFVTFAVRPAEEWLASDALQLRTDIQGALSALGADIASAYMPYPRR